MNFMKKLLLSIFLLLSVTNLQAQSISYIETTKNWYYIYDQNGKKIKTLSTSQGSGIRQNITSILPQCYLLRQDLTSLRPFVQRRFRT